VVITAAFVGYLVAGFNVVKNNKKPPISERFFLSLEKRLFSRFQDQEQEPVPVQESVREQGQVGEQVHLPIE
jgi:hypothetical protein